MRVLLTVDVEAHRVLDEISGVDHDSLGFILSAFDAHGVKGTFFVDVCGSETWGEEVVRRSCERILHRGHDVQLHVHPHHSTKDQARWHLSQYTPEEQASILGKAVDRYRAYVGTAPYAFRAGGFGIDDSSIDLLRAAGLQVDCSYMWGWRGCNIAPSARGLPSRYRDILELPMTPIVGLGTERWPIRIGPLDFNWQPLFVLKDALRTLRASGAPVAVLLLHSSSMYVRIGRRRLLYRRAHERKLRNLLEFLRSHDFRTATVTEATHDGLLAASPPLQDAVYVPRGLATQYRILLFQSLVGFGISAKFRAFVLAQVAGVALLVGLVLWAVRR